MKRPCKTQRPLGLLLIFLLLCGMTACSGTEDKVEIPAISGVNPNNYIAHNEMDCSDGYLALYREGWLGSTLTVYNADGKVNAMFNAWPDFRIFNRKLYYIKNEKLKQLDLQTGETTEIAGDVATFVVYDGNICYQTVDQWDDAQGEWHNQIHRWDPDSGTKQPLAQNLRQLFVHGDKLYATTFDDQLIEIGASGQTQTVLQLKPGVWPYQVFPQGDHLLMLDGSNKLVFVSMTTGETECFPIVEDALAVDRVYLICDETQIFVSYHAAKADGSIVTDIESENNGVWQITPDSKEVRKVSDTCFDSLYLCDGELWGVLDGKPSRIELPV